MSSSSISHSRPLTPVDVCEAIPRFHDGYYKTTVEGTPPADPYVMKVTGSKLQHFIGRNITAEDTVKYGQVKSKHFYLLINVCPLSLAKHWEKLPKSQGRTFLTTNGPTMMGQRTLG